MAGFSGSPRSSFEGPILSTQTDMRRLTANDIRARKGGEPIVALTAYHAHTAGIVDPLVDFILVGDSLGMVMHGLETTVPVTLDMMILQGQAVMRGSGVRWSWSTCPSAPTRRAREQAFRSAARVLKETGCGAIKLEGGARHGGDGAFPRRARRAGHGPCRPDPAVDQHHRRLQGAGAATRTERPPFAPTPRPWPRRAPSPWWSRRSSSRWRARSPGSLPSRPSASAPRPPATARSWCSRTCSA